MKTLNFICNDEKLEFNYDKCFAIGYAGRNIEKTKEHIDELERDLGVKPPKFIPTIFECSKEIVTQDSDLKFVGERTSGECEYVILLAEDEIYITVGSDHTDRDLESVNIFKSKQVCLKPLAKEAWKYDEVKDHWDDIKLNSYTTVDGKEVLYQEGTLGDILPVEKILSELEKRIGDVKNSVIFSGTVPTKDGFVFGDDFRAELIDEILNRKIEFKYYVNVIAEDER
ncbi:DUF2848 family protein [Peptoniphilus sp.]|jgi:hypothetical protein|uniref:DUF2848 family protein n=1 Tax=Peptoniphilus sp. TaxID=1971214 RepID=UPI003D8B4D0E